MTKPLFFLFIGALSGTILLGLSDVPFYTWIMIWSGLATLCAIVKFLVVSERDGFL